MAASQMVRVFSGINVETWLFTEMQDEFPLHFHNCIVAGMLLSGSRRLRYGKNERVINAGDLVCLPPRLPHSCRQLGGCKSVWVCLHIGLEQAGEGFQEAVIEKGALAFSYFKRLGEMLARNEPLNADWLVALINSLPTIQVHNPSPAAPTGLERLRAFIDQNCQGQVSLDEMAKLAKLEKFQMLRKFCCQTGVTPYRYLENMRLLRAQKLLQAGAPLADCALNAGYYDQSHFSRCFKASMGVTPGRYKRSWSGQPC